MSKKIAQNRATNNALLVWGEITTEIQEYENKKKILKATIKAINLEF